MIPSILCYHVLYVMNHQRPRHQFQSGRLEYGLGMGGVMPTMNGGLRARFSVVEMYILLVL